MEKETIKEYRIFQINFDGLPKADEYTGAVVIADGIRYEVSMEEFKRFVVGIAKSCNAKEYILPIVAPQTDLEKENGGYAENDEKPEFGEEK